MRDQLEQPFWKQYEQQLWEARARAEEECLHQEREREQWRKSQKEQGKQRRQQKNTEHHHKAPQQSVKKPETLAEALLILKLKPPTTISAIKHAFRMQALMAHPDHGGSHAAMVALNAAYELALASV